MAPANVQSHVFASGHCGVFVEEQKQYFAFFISSKEMKPQKCCSTSTQFHLKSIIISPQISSETKNYNSLFNIFAFRAADMCQLNVDSVESKKFNVACKCTTLNLYVLKSM